MNRLNVARWIKSVALGTAVAILCGCSFLDGPAIGSPEATAKWMSNNGAAILYKDNTCQPRTGLVWQDNNGNERRSFEAAAASTIVAADGYDFDYPDAHDSPTHHVNFAVHRMTEAEMAEKRRTNAEAEHKERDNFGTASVYVESNRIHDDHGSIAIVSCGEKDNMVTLSNNSNHRVKVSCTRQYHYNVNPSDWTQMQELDAPVSRELNPGELVVVQDQDPPRPNYYFIDPRSIEVQVIGSGAVKRFSDTQ